MSDETTRATSSDDLRELRERATKRRSAQQPDVKEAIVVASPAEEMAAASDRFDADEILRFWTPEERSTYWTPGLELNTRVEGTAGVRFRDPRSNGMRIRLLVALILLIALLVAVGLFFVAQRVGSDSPDESDEQVVAILTMEHTP